MKKSRWKEEAILACTCLKILRKSKREVNKMVTHWEEKGTENVGQYIHFILFELEF